MELGFSSQYDWMQSLSSFHHVYVFCNQFYFVHSMEIKPKSDPQNKAQTLQSS